MKKRPSGKKMVRHGRKTVKYGTLILILGLFLAALFLLRQLDRKILPSILAVAEMKAKTQMNAAIGNAVNRVMSERNVTAEDFFSKQENADGKVSSMSVNTILVNDICNQIAVRISSELNSINNQHISVPLGTLLGLQVFANTGPSYTFSVLPTGDTVVDYQSKMDAAGINQINFQVWLDVTSSVQIVNPLQRDKITITRNVPLVNAVLSEDVPGSYWYPQTVIPQGQ